MERVEEKVVFLKWKIKKGLPTVRVGVENNGFMHLFNQLCRCHTASSSLDILISTCNVNNGSLKDIHCCNWWRQRQWLWLQFVHNNYPDAQTECGTLPNKKTFIISVPYLGSSYVVKLILCSYFYIQYILSQTNKYFNILLMINKIHC